MMTRAKLDDACRRIKSERKNHQFDPQMIKRDKEIGFFISEVGSKNKKALNTYCDDNPVQKYETGGGSRSLYRTQYVLNALYFTSQYNMSFSLLQHFFE